VPRRGRRARDERLERTHGTWQASWPMLSVSSSTKQPAGVVSWVGISGPAA